MSKILRTYTGQEIEITEDTALNVADVSQLMIVTDVNGNKLYVNPKNVSEIVDKDYVGGL